MRTIRWALLICLATGLIACSTVKTVKNKTKHAFTNPDNNYAKLAKTIPPLTLPDSLDDSKILTYYPVPKLAQKGSKHPPSLFPPGSNLSKKA